MSLIAVTLAALCVALLSDAESAAAHAAYEESEPQFASVLDASPERILLRFSQELFRREGANTITLTNVESGGLIPLGQVEISNADRHVMSAPVLQSLPHGRYEASWTNLSAEDGDADSGIYPFYVGRQPSEAEVAHDRETAAALLIVYPGDQPSPAEAETTATTVTATVVRSVSDPATSDGTIGVGVWIWLAIGVVASGGLLAMVWRTRDQQAASQADG